MHCDVGKDAHVQTLTFGTSDAPSKQKLALQNMSLEGADEQAPQEDADDLLDLLDSVA